MTKFSSPSESPPVTPEAKPVPVTRVPRPPAGTGTNFKRERIKSPKHEVFIRSLPCVICGDNTSTECAHVSYADLRYGKMGRGMGQKEESIWVVPLCGRHHRAQHTMGERKFWSDNHIDPCRVAAALYIRTGSHEDAQLILDRARD